jgi:hypothetical protein
MLIGRIWVRVATCTDDGADAFVDPVSGYAVRVRQWPGAICGLR